MGKKNKPTERKRFQLLTTSIKGNEATDEPGVVKINLEFDLINGTSKVFNSFTNEALETDGMALGYIGENKWRTTARINSQKDDHSYSLKSKLDRFKHLVAIDTNTTIINGSSFEKPVSVSVGVAILLVVEESEAARLEMINRPFLASLDSVKPENENWVQLIQLLVKSCACEDPRLVGIVVDSDLGNLDDFNNRTKPLFNNFYLPEGYELIFASDKVNDTIFNEMIHRCHLQAKKLIDSFRQKFE